MSEQLVRCIIIDKSLKLSFPAGELFKPIALARQLQSRGLVKISEHITKDKIITKQNLVKQQLVKEKFPIGKDDFSSKDKIKIAWVMDYSKNGGSELSSKFLIKIGRNLGFDIVTVTPSVFRRRALNTADLIVINNFFEFPQHRMIEIYKAIYEKNTPYVKYEHDYRELTRIDTISRQMFTRSKLNIFISPAHKEAHIKKLGDQIGNHSMCFPLAIDTELFQKHSNIKRVNDSVLIPTARKGKDSIVRYIVENKEKEYTFIGNHGLTFGGKVKTKIINQCKVNEMVKLYNEHEYMLHLPLSPWAGERIYLEALLCGCKPITNDNVGHLSWEFTKTNLKKNLNDALYKFWHEIESLTNG